MSEASLFFDLKKAYLRVIERTSNRTDWGRLARRLGKEKDRTLLADVMTLLCWFLGGYLVGCLLMNLYWRFSNQAAAFAFCISVYENAAWTISADDLFWHLLQRDLFLLSGLFLADLFSWGSIMACTVVCVGGCLLGLLTSGILLEEGVYWWLRGILWMLPCFLCSGTVLAKELLHVWKGTYRLQRQRRPAAKQLLPFIGHVFLVICLAAVAGRVESIILMAFLAKK